MGFPVRVVPVGEDIWSVGHVISLVVRAAMIFGAIQPGDCDGFHKYTFERLNAFVNAYKPVNDITVACGAGAIKLGFPVITNDHDDMWAVPKSLIIYDDTKDWIDTSIEARGITVGPENLKLSDKATISMPWHKVQDGLEEDRLAKKGSAFGSTRRGIAYAYSDKYRKKTLRLGDLLHLDEKRTQNRLHMILDSKNMELAGCYHQEKMSYDALLNWCKLQAEHFTPYICDVGAFLQQAHDSGKRIVLEAQLGAMRDIDYGIFPFTSSSNTLAAYAPLGAGIPNCKLDHVVGVLKSYSTCVGAGPFAAENAMGEEWNEKLRKAGGEYGAATGRPRRVGPFDCVASRYGLACQGADKIALTKLDVLSSMEEIPVITGYKLDGVKVPRFDTLSDLDRMEPVVTMLPGWNKDISGCRSWAELPKEAKAYVEFLEKQLGHEIQFVSTGAEREKFVLKGEWL